MARGLQAVMKPSNLTVVVNVGDDDEMYGVHVSPDLDTVVYTLAGVEGDHGWGRRDDTFAVMSGLDQLGLDTTFRLGDLDLATCLERTNARRRGERLSAFTSRLAAALGVPSRVLPVTDDQIRTRVLTTDDEWLDFQEYFVLRGHRDRVSRLDFTGAEVAAPAPGVIDAVAAAAAIVIAPSNPPLSIWPILEIPAVRAAVAAKPTVVAVSPLFGGRALKGPADAVMADLGLKPGNAGVLEAYDDLITHLVVDADDAHDVASLGSDPVAVTSFDTRITSRDFGAGLAAEILRIVGESDLASPVR